MNEQKIEQAMQMVKALRGQSKEQVFKLWIQACLGRVHNAKMGEQRKDWMIYDIIKAQFDKEVADQVS